MLSFRLYADVYTDFFAVLLWSYDDNQCIILTTVLATHSIRLAFIRSDLISGHQYEDRQDRNMTIDKADLIGSQALEQHKHDQQEDGRRAFWSQKMDEAYTFMGKMMTYPVSECGEPMVNLRLEVHSAGVEVTFSDKPHINGLPRLYYLRQGLVSPFLAAASEMNERGWILKLEDGYRTLTMQRGLSQLAQVFHAVLDKVRWESQQDMPPGDLLFRRLAALVANAPKIGTHMSGSAMDISVLQRDTREEVDRGAPYIEMSELTPMD